MKYTENVGYTGNVARTYKVRCKNTTVEGKVYKVDSRIFDIFSGEFSEDKIRDIANRLMNIALSSKFERNSIRAAELIFKILAANYVINDRAAIDVIEKSVPPINHDILVKFQEEYEKHYKSNEPRVLPG